jgi:hypothetical protein
MVIRTRLLGDLFMSGLVGYVGWGDVLQICIQRDRN